MQLNGRRIEEYNEELLTRLVDAAVEESKQVEFKEELPGRSNQERKEFLADFSSFANTAGGHLAYGVVEDEGVAVNVNGIDAGNPDEEKLRIEEMVRNGIEPRIMGIKIQVVRLQNGRFVILIAIPKSWNSPHMVVFQGTSRFFARNNAGKYQMDVTEIRAAFLNSDSRQEKIRKYRLQRTSQIASEDALINLRSGAKLVLHIVPLNAFELSVLHDISVVHENRQLLQPMGADAYDHRFNIDGFLSFRENHEEVVAYAQYFRNGIIETTDARILTGRDELMIPSQAYEQNILSVIPRYIQLMNLTGADYPYVIMLTMINVRGYRMYVNLLNAYHDEVRAIDRDIIIAPEVVWLDPQDDLDVVMKPIFDAVWNASGLPSSQNYREGRWNPNR